MFLVQKESTIKQLQHCIVLTHCFPWSGVLLQPELAVGDPAVPVPVHDLDHLVNLLQAHLHPALRSPLVIGMCIIQVRYDLERSLTYFARQMIHHKLQLLGRNTAWQAERG